MSDNKRNDLKNIEISEPNRNQKYHLISDPRHVVKERRQEREEDIAYRINNQSNKLDDKDYRSGNKFYKPQEEHMTEKDVRHEDPNLYNPVGLDANTNKNMHPDKMKVDMSNHDSRKLYPEK
jgi:hypothetical protein